MVRDITTCSTLDTIHFYSRSPTWYTDLQRSMAQYLDSTQSGTRRRHRDSPANIRKGFEWLMLPGPRATSHADSKYDRRSRGAGDDLPPVGSRIMGRKECKKNIFAVKFRMILSEIELSGGQLEGWFVHILSLIAV